MPMISRSVAAEVAGPPMTRDYRPSYGNRPAWYGNRGQIGFHYGIISTMLEDPTVTLGKAMISTPVIRHEGQWQVLADTPAVQHFVDTTLRTFWQRSIRPMLSEIEYGFAGGEVLYRLHPDRSLHFDGVKPLFQEDIAPGTDPRTGTLGGVIVKAGSMTRELRGAEGLRPAKGFWVYQGDEYNNYFGRSRLTAAYMPWYEKNGVDGTLDIIRMWYYKNAYSGLIIRHPEKDVPTGGLKVPARDMARNMAEVMKTGGVAAIPSTVDPKTGQPEWSVEWPHMNGNAEGLLEYLNLQDSMILRGMTIPDDVVTSVGGAYGGRKVSEDAFYTTEEDLLHSIAVPFDAEVIKPLVWYNFGPGDKYKIVYAPMLPARQQLDAVRQAGVAAQGAPGAGNPEVVPTPLSDAMEKLGATQAAPTQMSLEVVRLANDPPEWFGRYRQLTNLKSAQQEKFPARHEAELATLQQKFNDTFGPRQPQGPSRPVAIPAGLAEQMPTPAATPPVATPYKPQAFPAPEGSSADVYPGLEDVKPVAQQPVARRAFESRKDQEDLVARLAPVVLTPGERHAMEMFAKGHKTPFTTQAATQAVAKLQQAIGQEMVKGHGPLPRSHDPSPGTESPGTSPEVAPDPAFQVSSSALPPEHLGSVQQAALAPVPQPTSAAAPTPTSGLRNPAGFAAPAVTAQSPSVQHAGVPTSVAQSPITPPTPPVPAPAQSPVPGGQVSPRTAAPGTPFGPFQVTTPPVRPPVQPWAGGPPPPPVDPTIGEAERLKRVAELTAAHAAGRSFGTQHHDELASLVGAPQGFLFTGSRGQGSQQEHVFRDADGFDYAVDVNGKLVGAYDGRSYDRSWFKDGRLVTNSTWRRIGQDAGSGKTITRKEHKAMLAHLGVPGFGYYGGHFGDKHVITDLDGNDYSLLPGRRIVASDGKVYGPDDFENGRLIKFESGPPTPADLAQVSSKEARRKLASVYGSPVRINGRVVDHAEYAKARAVSPNREQWLRHDSRRTGIPVAMLREVSDLEHKHLILGQADDNDLIRLSKLRDDGEAINRAYNRANRLIGEDYSRFTPEQKSQVSRGLGRLNQSYGNLTAGQRAALAAVVLLSALVGGRLGGAALPLLAAFFLQNHKAAQEAGDEWVPPSAVPLRHRQHLLKQLGSP